MTAIRTICGGERRGAPFGGDAHGLLGDERDRVALAAWRLGRGARARGPRPAGSGTSLTPSACSAIADLAVQAQDAQPALDLVLAACARTAWPWRRCPGPSRHPVRARATELTRQPLPPACALARVQIGAMMACRTESPRGAPSPLRSSSTTRCRRSAATPAACVTSGDLAALDPAGRRQEPLARVRWRPRRGRAASSSTSTRGAASPSLDAQHARGHVVGTRSVVRCVTRSSRSRGAQRRARCSAQRVVSRCRGPNSSGPTRASVTPSV